MYCNSTKYDYKIKQTRYLNSILLVDLFMSNEYWTKKDCYFLSFVENLNI